MKTKGFSIGIIFLVLLVSTSCTKDEVDINSTPLVDGDYFVATSGDDANDGSFTSPWATWHYAFNQLSAGDTLYIRGGVYYITDEDYYSTSQGVYVNNIDGTAANNICVFNYPEEKPILDGSLIDEVVSTDGVDFYLCEYWHVKGLTIRNFPQVSGGAEAEGFGASGSKNMTFENLISYQNGGSGLYMHGEEGVEMTGNKFINCDSYDNYDPYSATDGGGADGFELSGMHNLTDSVILIGCRAWGNSDDGYDGWGTEGIIVYQDCWAFNNGYIANGDGNGFKLGKSDSKVSSIYIRQLYNCIALGNKLFGLVENGTDGLIKVLNFTSYLNDSYGIVWDGDDVASIYRNIASFGNEAGNYAGDYAVKTHDHNSYHAVIEPDGPVAAANDFFSLDTMELYKDRKPDGSLPDIEFGKLRPSSDLVDAGIDVGLDYHGLRPDIGAIESFGR